MPRTLYRTLLAACLTLAGGHAGAEDIDLFVGNPGDTVSRPNVLIILDNTANWNQAYANEKGALVSAVSGLNENFNVGLMLFVETGNPNTNVDGAYVRAAARQMTDTNKAAFTGLLSHIAQDYDKGNNATYGVTMAEAYRYFAGAEAYAGAGKIKRDYGGNALTITGNNASGNPDYAYSNAVYALPGNAFAAASSTSYISPITDACQKNFIIFISNGPANDNNSSIATANQLLSQAGGNTTTIPLVPSGAQSNPADEWARFLANNDVSASLEGTQRVTTYTIDVDPGTTGQGPNHTALLKSMAYRGEGKYFAVSSGNGGSDIAAALNQILIEIQADNSVFASASLPVSVNTQGTYLNQVFIGMFRPDEHALPRWDGNMKQYQFKASLVGDSIVLNLADKDGNAAINNNTGFITSCAKSFWTPDDADSYWNFNGSTYEREPGICSAETIWSNSPDGDLVERGAAGYRLRAGLTPSTRNVKTCDDGCTTLASFDTANDAISTALLGVDTDTERTALINWIRGADVDAEKPGQTAADMRPSVHGDVVHSRPLAVDYGGNTNVVVFYGANDGALRAINGNQTSSIGGAAPGNELWAFIAPEHYGNFVRLRANSPIVKYPNLPDPEPPAQPAQPKTYFFDGPIGSYKSGSTVWIYPTMRRGGRMLYAFDVSTPSVPSLKWRQGCPDAADDTGCTTGFTSIGQTWSEPKVLKADGYRTAADASGSGTLKPLVLVGGGYDTCEDAEPNSCTSPKGDKVFVIDADSGTLLKALDTERSVAADVALVDANNDGMAELAYAVDTGGNIYRIDIGSDAPADWQITRIAALGCATPTSSCSYNRKFLQTPQVVPTNRYNAILVGSGDREHPLQVNNTFSSVDNAFFMVKDAPADPDWLSSESGNCNNTDIICMASLLSIDPSGTTTPTAEQLNAAKGWYLQFGSGIHDGEQVVTSAVVIGGLTYFSTHTPTTPLDCGTDLGTARGYAVSFVNGEGIDGGARFGTFVGGGLPPSPVAGIVEVDNPIGDGTIRLPFIIGGMQETGDGQDGGGDDSCGGSPIEVCKPNISITGKKLRTHWYIERK